MDNGPSDANSFRLDAQSPGPQELQATSEPTIDWDVHLASRRSGEIVTLLRTAILEANEKRLPIGLLDNVNRERMFTLIDHACGALQSDNSAECFRDTLQILRGAADRYRCDLALFLESASGAALDLARPGNGPDAQNAAQEKFGTLLRMRLYLDPSFISQKLALKLPDRSHYTIESALVGDCLRGLGADDVAHIFEGLATSDVHLKSSRERKLAENLAAVFQDNPAFLEIIQESAGLCDRFQGELEILRQDRPVVNENTNSVETAAVGAVRRSQYFLEELLARQVDRHELSYGAAQQLYSHACESRMRFRVGEFMVAVYGDAAAKIFLDVIDRSRLPREARLQAIDDYCIFARSQNAFKPLAKHLNDGDSVVVQMVVHVLLQEPFYELGGKQTLLGALDSKHKENIPLNLFAALLFESRSNHRACEVIKALVDTRGSFDAQLARLAQGGGVEFCSLGRSSHTAPLRILDPQVFGLAALIDRLGLDNIIEWLDHGGLAGRNAASMLLAAADADRAAVVRALTRAVGRNEHTDLLVRRMVGMSRLGKAEEGLSSYE